MTDTRLARLALKLPPSQVDTIIANARAYVQAQLETMRRHGGAPTLTDDELDALIQKCAIPAAEIAVAIRRAERKARR